MVCNGSLVDFLFHFFFHDRFMVCNGGFALMMEVAKLISLDKINARPTQNGKKIDLFLRRKLYEMETPSSSQLRITRFHLKKCSSMPYSLS